MLVIYTNILNFITRPKAHIETQKAFLSNGLRGMVEENNLLTYDLFERHFSNIMRCVWNIFSKCLI